MTNKLDTRTETEWYLGFRRRPNVLPLFRQLVNNKRCHFLYIVVIQHYGLRAKQEDYTAIRIMGDYARC